MGDGLNRNQLKYIAAAAMLLDHIGFIFCADGSLMEFVLRLFGRITAPVMCFFLAEGFVRTSSRKKYFLRLLAGAALSQLPYTLAVYGRIRADRWSMMATLLLSFLLLWADEAIQEDFLRVIVFVVLFAGSYYCDWSMFAPVLVLLMYRGRGNTGRQARSFAIWASLETAVSLFAQNGRPWHYSLWELGVFLFIPLLYSWNEKKGSSAPFHKWFFYAFYPLHLIILYLVKVNL